MSNWTIQALLDKYHVTNIYVLGQLYKWNMLFNENIRYTCHVILVQKCLYCSIKHLKWKISLNMANSISMNVWDMSIQHSDGRKRHSYWTCKIKESSIFNCPDNVRTVVQISCFKNLKIELGNHVRMHLIGFRNRKHDSSDFSQDGILIL